MRLYTVEKLGPKQALTPEGFLVCYDVPVARVGVMDYHELELPDLEAKDGVIQVERTEDVVFSPETIASFVGKPVTIDHPFEPVTPSNWLAFAKGNAMNVRRGEGDQSNLLLADLLITDRVAIDKVRGKDLTEVSCGYDSQYEQIAPGRARQATVVGNHVALVKNARCGPVCTIGDSFKNLSGENPMAAKKGAKSVSDLLRKMFMTRDSEGFEKALSEVNDEDLGGEGKEIHIHVGAPAAPGAGVADKTKDADDPDELAAGPLAELTAAVKGLAETVTGIGERVAKLEAGKTADADPDDDPGADPDGETTDADPDGDPDKSMTADSATFRGEFQDTMSRAEILAPGIKLPTYDKKAAPKKTSDSLCVLRRRALRAAGENDNAEIVQSLMAGADLTKMTCDAVKTTFVAASEVIKQKNMLADKAKHQQTHDSGGTSWAETQNKRNADFWANRK